MDIYRWIKMLPQNIIWSVFIVSVLLLVWGEEFDGFEYFANPKVSSAEDVEGGASDYYNWGYKEISEDQIPHSRHHCPRCQKSCYIPMPYRHKRYPCPYCKTKIEINEKIFFIKDRDCSAADITKNRDIDKYVLKSSVPACPDMSQFVKKSQLRPDEHGGKRRRPEDCPKCPICPICPKCPEPKADKIKHPDYYKYKRDDEYSSTSIDDYGEDNWPGNRTGAIPAAPGNDLGLDDYDVSKQGTTPKAGQRPEPYFKDFAYNNRGSGRIRAYNSIWRVFG